ncbi:unnamed protein product, partial [Ectocarpus sp. 12 AP-2014]
SVSKSGFTSETESLAELVVNSVTNSALLRSISSNSSFFKTGVGSTDGTGNRKGEDKANASAAALEADAHEMHASTKSVLMSETESLAEVVVNSVTQSALLRSASDSSSLIKTRNGSVNGAGSCIVEDEVEPAAEAAAAAVAVHSHGWPATTQSGLMSETESLAELVVNSVTNLALLRSLPSNSLIKTGANSMHGTGNVPVEHELEASTAAPVVDAHELPASTKSVLMSETESLAELVVNSVTQSALLRSTSDSSSLVKAGNGSMNGTGGCNIEDEVDPATAAAAVLDADERPSSTQLGLMSEAESLAELVVHSVTTSAVLSFTPSSSLIEYGVGTMDSVGNGAAENEVELVVKATLNAENQAAAVKNLVPAEAETLTGITVQDVAASVLQNSTGGVLKVGEESSPLSGPSVGKRFTSRKDGGTESSKLLSNGPDNRSRKRSRDGAGSNRTERKNASASEAGEMVGRKNPKRTDATYSDHISSSNSRRLEGPGGAGGAGGDPLAVRKRDQEYSPNTFEEDDSAAVNPNGSILTDNRSQGPNAYQRSRKDLPSGGKSVVSNAMSAFSTTPPTPTRSPQGSLGCGGPRHDRASSLKGTDKVRSTALVPRVRDDHLKTPAPQTRTENGKDKTVDPGSPVFGRPVAQQGVAPFSSSASMVSARATSSAGPANSTPTDRTNSELGSPAGAATVPRVVAPVERSACGRSGSVAKVVGLAGLKHDVTAWFDDEVWAPSAARVIATVANNRRERPESRLSSTSHTTGISHDAPSAYKDGGRTTFRNSSSTRNSRCGSLDVDVDVGQHEPGLKTVGDGTAKPDEHGNRQLQTVHPARLFHLLWQRDRSRCPFSRCPIPDTVVFNSMGEAGDWFFTSKLEGGIKRKLTSNTLFSNIFRDFCKGSTDGDPVAVIISWIPRNDDGIMSAASAGDGRDIQPGMAHARSQQHLQKPASQQPQHAKIHHPQLENQQDAAIRHLTARELHDFLFGSNHHQHPVPPVVAAATGGKQQRNEIFSVEEVDAFHTIGRGSLLHVQERSDGGAGPYTETFARRHIERSEAAATAAGAGAGDRDGSGWCLLQKYIGPTGTRNSTLRCHWSAVSSHTPARVRSAHPEVVERHRFRLGSVEEIEMSFRDRSPDRSPFRQRLSDQSVPKQSVKETAGLELGAAERLSSSGGVYNGCLLERSTNVFRADRKDLPCEHRCVTFEEPPPSSRGGLWPRSVREPMKSPALRQTVVEACTAAWDHVSQVTRGEFRPKLATSYFRQGEDGRTYLMFLSRWAGQSPSHGIDANEPLLCRTGTGSATLPIHDSIGLDQKARFQHGVGMGVEPTFETTASPDREGSEEGLGAQQEYGRPHLHRLVCPGCGRSGIRGGVRCDNNGSSTMHGDIQVRGIAPSHLVMKQNTGPAMCCPSTNCNDAVSNLRDCTRNDKVAAGEEPSTRAPSLHGLTSTAFPPLDCTVHTSLGVVVDVCTWSETLRGGHAAQNGDCGSIANNGRRTIARAGVKRCFRVLNKLHPGVRAETVSVRCNEDLRLRLRRVSVCRECALEIAGASDVRLREMNDAAKRKMSELAARLGVTSSAPSLSERQRKARVSEDIKAFKRRFASASSEPSQTRARLQSCFGGGPSRMGEVPINQFGHVPKRPLGKRLGNRPSTTDGLSPRQQVFQHSPRKIVSATQSPGGFSFAAKYHEEVRMTTPSNGKSATETPFRSNNEGRANETTTSSALRYTSCESDADGGSGGDGGGGGGGDDSIEDRGGPDDGFDSSSECVSADETSAMNAWQDERKGHIQTRHENQQQRQRQRQQQQQPEHHRGCKDNTGITGWNFYDRSNIAFRSRRLLATYSGTGIGDPVGGGVSPRRAGNARSAKASPAEDGAGARDVSAAPPPRALRVALRPSNGRRQSARKMLRRWEAALNIRHWSPVLRDGILMTGQAAETVSRKNLGSGARTATENPAIRAAMHVAAELGLVVDVATARVPREVGGGVNQRASRGGEPNAGRERLLPGIAR